MSTAIAIRDLVKEFRSRRETTRAVDAISLDIEPGELFFLLGPSGCGKTTLLRMIAGFIDPTSGSIAFNGRDVTHAPPNTRNTGMVFQSYALWPHMTVEANVAFGLGVRKVPSAAKRTRAIEALRQVQMAAYADRKPNQLSGGQQQRVALARALVIRPDVLLLDEPLSNLDAKLRNELRVEIRSICKEAGITTVYVTHDQKEALSMADRIAVLRDGAVVQQGTPRELYRRPSSRFVASFLGETNFIEARVARTADGALHLDTQAGRFVASGDAEDEQTVLCSIRPEAIRLVEPKSTGSLMGRHVRTTYLGEVAHHTIDLPGTGLVHAAQLNPFGHGAAETPDDLAPGRPVALDIAPEDVVVLERA